MSSDQAQSTRLGQPVPTETTYVRMFDVDPNTPDADLIEASWPGQLIYRSDISILMVFMDGGWHEVAGGIAGAVSYVGPTMPTGNSFQIGDTWYDSDAGMKPYVWDGDSWEPSTGGGIRSFRLPSPPMSTAIGDIWYDSNDGDKMYRAASVGATTIGPTGWVLVQDQQIPMAYDLANQAVKSSVVEYAVNASETVAPTSGWSTATPTRAAGQFIWVRTTVTRNDNTTSTTNPALMTGNTGATGPPGDAGPQGVPGPAGPGGQQLYTWVKYADTPTSGMSDDPTGKEYLGLSYNQASAAESSNYNDYQWSLTKGEDGTDGADGVPGPPGSDGQPTYTWIRYADSITGTGISNSSVGKTHMGIAYNKTTATESNTPTDYEWSLIQGPQGTPGPQGSQGVPGPAGSDGQSLYTWIKYADTPTTGMSDLPAGKTYMGIAYNKTTATESGVYTDYEWSLIQGPEGDQGVPGPPGANGQATYTWVKYADTPTTGMSDSPANKPYLGLSYNQPTATESNVYTDYQWSLVQGPPGTSGSNGVSITAVTPYYATVAKGAAQPTQPTNQATPPAPWVTTEPAYVKNTELYRTEKITYSNTTYSYTTVVKVSAYTAAGNAQDTADSKTRAYYANGYEPDDDDPNTPRVFVPLTVAPDGQPLTAGDVWYQIDALNQVWFWTGTAWVDATDPNTKAALELAQATQGALDDLNISVENLALLGSSTNNTADTADGRISTSDYVPGPDDLTYTQTRTELDTTVEPPVPIEVEYTASRQNGSIWFTQTRPRTNMCTNPSVELTLAGWTASGATIIRDNPAAVPVGLYAIKVTATGTNDHMVSWGAATPAPAKPGETWTASMYAGMLAGSKGVNVRLELVWTNINGVEISATAGVPMQMPLEMWTQTSMESGAGRMVVTGQAPAATTGVYVRQVSPAGQNNSDVWHTEALLLEVAKDVGRYFDGDSYDGYWGTTKTPGAAHASTSGLNGDKIFQVWELRNNDWVRKFFTDDTMAPIDASQIVGTMDGELVGDNTIVQDKQFAALVKALEPLDVGDIVNVYNDHGIFTARKADARLGKNYEAHGFVIDTTAQGANVRVYHTGYNKYLTGLTPGAAWLSPVPGKVQNRPAHAAGELIQQVGFAPSATILDFQPRVAIKIS